MRINSFTIRMHKSQFYYQSRLLVIRYYYKKGIRFIQLGIGYRRFFQFCMEYIIKAYGYPSRTN